MVAAEALAHGLRPAASQPYVALFCHLYGLHPHNPRRD